MRPKNWVPASCSHLDPKKLEKAFIATGCSVAATARRLRVPAIDLRRLLMWSGLAATAVERTEQTLDKAEAVLRDGLDNPDMGHRLMAAKALLTLSDAGRRRGFGRGGTGRALRDDAVELEPVTLRWLDGDGAKRQVSHETSTHDLATARARSMAS